VVGTVGCGRIGQRVLQRLKARTTAAQTLPRVSRKPFRASPLVTSPAAPALQRRILHPLHASWDRTLSVSHAAPCKTYHAAACACAGNMRIACMRQLRLRSFASRRAIMSWEG
jgi:hypothetical protein